MATSNHLWRVAIIGAGDSVHYAHGPGFQRLANTEIAAVCDVNESRARLRAEEIGAAAVFTDYQEMLRSVRPDIVVIATPNVFHKPMTLAALKAGAHVLCEKPLALTYADAVEMYEEAERRERVLTVGTHFRFTPAMQAAKRQMEAGFFGRIYAARTVWQRRSGIPGYGSWFTNRDLAGGGVLLDLGVHTLDRALYLMGYPRATTVSGATFAELGPRGLGLGGWGAEINAAAAGARYDVDDLAWAFIRLANGAVLQFQAAWASHLPESMVTEILGTAGGAQIGVREQLDLFTVLNHDEATIKVPLHEAKVSSYLQLIENFVRYLDGDTTADIVTPEQALVSAEILDAMTRSAESGREIVLR